MRRPTNATARIPSEGWVIVERKDDSRDRSSVATVGEEGEKTKADRANLQQPTEVNGAVKRSGSLTSKFKEVFSLSLHVEKGGPETRRKQDVPLEEMGAAGHKVLRQ